MYYKFTVPVPEVPGKIYTKMIRNVTYVNYEYDRVYKPEKQYNIPKRTTIGKLCEDDPTMMYPNPNFLKYFPDAELPVDLGSSNRSSCLRIGTYLVIQKIIMESMLENIICGIYKGDERGSGLFFDLAAYAIVTENNAAQYYPDYAYNHPLFTPKSKIYSDATVSEFINQISIDDSVKFQNEWNSIKDHREKIYISDDSTNKNCQAGDIDIVEYGHPKDDKGLPVFNLSIAYDTKHHDPLFYEEYPGSIVDISQFQRMLEKAQGYGYRHVGFILDRGYFSQANIHFMDKCGYDFVIMVKGMKSFISEAVMSVKDTFENKWECRIKDHGVYGTTLKKHVFASDEKNRYLHIYYNAAKSATERAHLEDHLNKMEEYLNKVKGKPVLVPKNFEEYYYLEYYHEGQEDQCFVCGIPKEDAISRALKLCGYFCIITSEEMSAKEALEIYKSRDASEKLFQADKSFLGNHSARVCSEESLDGKILIEFIALIIRNRIYTALREEVHRLDTRPNYMTVPAAIRELEKIEMIRLGDGTYRMDHALTATQKVILKAFGIDSRYVTERVKEIRERLAPETLEVKI